MSEIAKARALVLDWLDHASGNEKRALEDLAQRIVRFASRGARRAEATTAPPTASPAAPSETPSERQSPTKGTETAVGRGADTPVRVSKEMGSEARNGNQRLGATEPAAVHKSRGGRAKACGCAPQRDVFCAEHKTGRVVDGAVTVDLPPPVAPPPLRPPPPARARPPVPLAAPVSPAKLGEDVCRVNNCGVAVVPGKHMCAVHLNRLRRSA